jgi:hypothetical protein
MFVLVPETWNGYPMAGTSGANLMVFQSHAFWQQWCELSIVKTVEPTLVFCSCFIFTKFPDSLEMNR